MQAGSLHGIPIFPPSLPRIFPIPRAGRPYLALLWKIDFSER